jgi:hypothetical protein
MLVILKPKVYIADDITLEDARKHLNNLEKKARIQVFFTGTVNEAEDYSTRERDDIPWILKPYYIGNSPNIERTKKVILNSWFYGFEVVEL